MDTTWHMRLDMRPDPSRLGLLGLHIPVTCADEHMPALYDEIEDCNESDTLRSSLSSASALASDAHNGAHSVAGRSSTLSRGVLLLETVVIVSRSASCDMSAGKLTLCTAPAEMALSACLSSHMIGTYK